MRNTNKHDKNNMSWKLLLTGVLTYAAGIAITTIIIFLVLNSAAK